MQIMLFIMQILLFPVRVVLRADGETDMSVLRWADVGRVPGRAEGVSTFVDVGVSTDVVRWGYKNVGSERYTLLCIPQ